MKKIDCLENGCARLRDGGPECEGQCLESSVVDVLAVPEAALVVTGETFITGTVEVIDADELWLSECPVGERREVRERVGDVEHHLVVDRRSVDDRTLAELIACKSPKFRENIRVLLDLLEAEGVGVPEVREHAPDRTAAPALPSCDPASGRIRSCEPAPR